MDQGRFLGSGKLTKDKPSSNGEGFFIMKSFYQTKGKVISFGLFIFTLATVFFLKICGKPVTDELYLANTPIISEIAPEEENKVESVILNINERSNLIRNFGCDIEIQIDDGKRIVRLRADLDYEKPIRFRMKTRSVLGSESDLGSNDNIFWFWSKRMNPPALHWALHTDLHKTRLKTPFNPMWIMESLSLGKVNEKADLRKTDKYWALTERRVNTMGQLVNKMTLIDPQKERIMGHYLFERGQMVASTEIKEWTTVGGVSVPQKLVIIWHDEDVKLQWNLVNIRINTPIDSRRWQMPDRSYKIDMGND